MNDGILDFGFWILDYALPRGNEYGHGAAAPQSKIQNPKSKIPPP